MKIETKLVNRIIDELKKLEKDFQKYKALILTEDDLKCHIFHRIYSFLHIKSRTMDSDILGSHIHSEVKFYDEHEKLTLVPDITILSPRNTSIYHSVEFKISRSRFHNKKYGELPSKSYEMGGDAIILELKFCRNKNGISESDIKKYKTDLDKIKRLQKIISKKSNGNDKLFGIVIVFNKTNKGKSIFDSFAQKNSQNETIKIMYASGLVDFEKASNNLTDDGFYTEINSLC